MCLLGDHELDGAESSSEYNDYLPTSITVGHAPLSWFLVLSCNFAFCTGCLRFWVVSTCLLPRFALCTHLYVRLDVPVPAGVFELVEGYLIQGNDMEDKLGGVDLRSIEEAKALCEDTEHFASAFAGWRTGAQRPD